MAILPRRCSLIALFLLEVIQVSIVSDLILGTLSVNAHGITSDDAIVTSVLSLRVILWDGKIVVCSRKKNTELFSLVIGGYGLFGILFFILFRLD
jgi:FAD/FMN-containing dehydrogenase